MQLPQRQDKNYRRRAMPLHEIARGKLTKPVSDQMGGRLADEHAIAVAVEAVFGCDGVAIGAEDIFLSGERGYQREQAGLREMEIGEELVHYAGGLAGGDEYRRCGVCRGYVVDGGELGCRIWGVKCSPAAGPAAAPLCFAWML